MNRSDRNHEAHHVGFPRQPWFQATLTFAVLATLVLLVAVGSAVPFGSIVALQARIAAILIPTLAMAAFLVRNHLRRGAAGAVLVDCGPTAEAQAFMGAGFALLSLLVLAVVTGSAWYLLLLLALGVAAALARAVGRLQFCEEGIWDGLALTRWSRVERARWDSRLPGMVNLRVRASRSVRRFFVPIEWRQEVHDVLRERLCRCPHCGYDLTGHPRGAIRCPECGTRVGDAEAPRA